MSCGDGWNGPKAFSNDLCDFKVLSSLYSVICDFSQHFIIQPFDSDFINFLDLECYY